MQTKFRSKDLLPKLIAELDKAEEDQDKDLIKAYRLLINNDKEFGTRTSEELTKEVFVDYKNEGYSDNDIAKEFGISRSKMYERKCEFGLVRKKEVTQ